MSTYIYDILNDSEIATSHRPNFPLSCQRQNSYIKYLLFLSKKVQVNVVANKSQDK